MPQWLQLLIWCSMGVGAISACLAAMSRIMRGIRVAVRLIDQLEIMNRILPDLLRVGEELKLAGPEALLDRIRNIEQRADEAVAKVNELRALTHLQNKVLGSIEKEVKKENGSGK